MNTLFLSVRVLHIMFGAIWLGTAVFATLMVLPAMRNAGPAGGQVMLELGKRRFDAYIGSIAGITVLTGLWLYWRYTDGFTLALMGSAGGHAFGTGGLLGLIAAVIASSVVSRNMKRAGALLKDMDTADPARKQALMDQVLQHRRKAAIGGRIVVGLLLITISLMGVGHYV